MGLLAIVAGQARKFELLPRLLNSLPFVSLLCLVAGLTWVAILPLEGQFRNTYMSENALLPHQAITFFRETEWDILRGFKGFVRELHDEQVSEEDRNNQITELFEQFGLKPATHTWSANNITGQNVYAMQHASRGPHNEAIVIVAPWIGSRGKFNEGGVSLLLALARFFQRWNFLHKNLIFALPSNSDIALREWVDAYHTSLQYTAGSIEGAVVLNYEFDAEFFDHIEVCFEGLNGQLPNLDLVNTAIHSVRAEFAQVTVLGGSSPDNYLGRLESLTRHIWQQATAGITSSCGSSMFSGWRIDAVTLDAIPGNSNNDITTFGRVCESTVRSINNLLEHFHQSFFFYLMLGTNIFVSIASYLPASMLIANSFSIMALYRFAKISASIRFTEWGVAVAVASSLGVISSLLGHFVDSPLVIMVSLALVFFALNIFLTRFTYTVKQLTYAIGLCVLGLELTTLAMVNFSLAFAIGLACAPSAWIQLQKESTSSIRALINGFIVALSCPVVAMMALAHYVFDKPLIQFFTDLISSYHGLGVSTWMVIMVTWVPFWMIAASCI